MSYAFSLQQLSPMKMADIKLIEVYREKISALTELQKEVKHLSQTCDALKEAFTQSQKIPTTHANPSPAFEQLSADYAIAASSNDSTRMKDFYQNFRLTFGDMVLKRNATDKSGKAIFTKDADYCSYLTIYTIYIHGGRAHLFRHLEDQYALPKDSKIDDKLDWIERRVTQEQALLEELKLKAAFYTASIDWTNHLVIANRPLSLIEIITAKFRM